MKNLKNIFFSLLVLMSTTMMAQQTPAGKQKGSILITGATAHLGNGQTIENSAIGFDNGKLTYVGTLAQADRNSFSRVIDASGKHVYPGFIAGNTTLGLVEVDAIRATDDDAEIGGIIPHVRSLIAYNAESKVVESMRPNGVLMAQITPQGGRISGTSSVVQFDAWNWEDAAVKADDGIHMNWPNSFTRGRWWLGEDPRLVPSKNYSEQVEEVVSFIREARAYLKGSQSPRNLPYEAVKGLFDGTQRLYVHVNGEKEIVDAVNFTKENGIQKLVIIGGDEAHKVADLLANNNVSVMISRPHRLPNKEDDNVKHPFNLAKLLMDKGVVVGIEMNGRMNRQESRNLPFFAGSFAAYGIGKEDAVKMISGNAAKILGIDDIAGTLEKGKDATLFISEGDALDMRTNIVSHAFIQGREVSLETHQTKLWKRYSQKFGDK
ncbi:amidohydrolase family protein [Leptobacterium flavescens]|uniref:Amidohydrolase family protein n=1 Tax=Leptobacterium flavescens TaxID=472055 RepID=A0A6P0ULB2_9FLAO|nr:amidohydrolase family protein [Leptobacterium flavescens]NER14151.1 amidohydrolase family protein [Leptobacterium flavescens]